MIMMSAGNCGIPEKKSKSLKEHQKTCERRDAERYFQFSESPIGLYKKVRKVFQLFPPRNAHEQRYNSLDERRFN